MDSLLEHPRRDRDGAVKAFYVHLAEGRSDNELSRNEFGKLVELKALTPATVVIHGTALARDELAELRDAGREARLVPAVEPAPLWGDDQSRRRARARPPDRTRRRLAAERHHQPPGRDQGRPALRSQSSAADRRREELVRHGHLATRRGSPGSRTSSAASRRAGPPTSWSSSAARQDPYENVVEADPSWVELVMIGGNLVYGRADWLPGARASVDQDRVEPLIAWGKPMLLDTSYTAAGCGRGAAAALRASRSALIAEYPQVGPIFA